MPILKLTALLSPLLVAQAAPAAAEALASRLKFEGGVDVYYGFNFLRPADAASFIPGTGTSGQACTTSSPSTSPRWA